MHTSGWMVTAAIAIVGYLLLKMSAQRRLVPDSLLDDVHPGMHDMALLESRA